MKIYLAADHAGYELKDKILLFLEMEKDFFIEELKKQNIIVDDLEIFDYGAYRYDPEDDYPKYISVCAGALSSDIYTGIKNNLAIVFGGSGEGEAIVADKFKGIRAGVINSENIELVKLLREHNNANILSFGARFISEDFAKESVKVFILTQFVEVSKNEKTRHERRIEEIDELEAPMLSKNDIEAKNEKIERVKRRERIMDN